MLRPLPLFLVTIAALESLFFAALTPLLPSFEESLSLSKGRAGLLVAMYPIGWSAAALPVGLLAPRIGVKRATLAGLAALALASAGFGLADGYTALLVVRFLQGAAATLAFSAGLAWFVAEIPRARRGEAIGLYAGAAAAGATLGPAIGGAADLAGRSVVFVGVGVLALGLVAVGIRLPASAPRSAPTLGARNPLRSPRALWASQWIVVLPGLLLGTIYTLAPLQLRELGWSTLGIAAVFLAAAAVGVVARPLIGRWADRRGLVAGLRVLLLVSVAGTVTVALMQSSWPLAVAVVCAVTAYGVLWGPAMALASNLYQDAGTTHVFGFALMALTSGIGLSVGASAGGRLAEFAGDEGAYALVAIACAATVPVLRGSRA